MLGFLGFISLLLHFFLGVGKGWGRGCKKKKKKGKQFEHAQCRAFLNSKDMMH